MFWVRCVDCCDLLDPEDSGVWSKEKELQLFVVPNCHYGYVDSKWYLEMSFPGAYGGLFCCPLGNAVEGRQVLPAESTQSEHEVLDGAAAASMRSPAACAALMGVDTVKPVKRYSSLFRTAVSFGCSPRDLCKSERNTSPPTLAICNDGKPPLCTEQNASLQQHGGLQLVERATAESRAYDAPSQRFCSPHLPHKDDPISAGKNAHEVSPAESPHSFPEGVS